MLRNQEPDLVACSKRAEQSASSDDSCSLINVAAPTPTPPPVSVSSSSSTAAAERDDEFVISSRRLPLPSVSSAGSGPEPPDYLAPPLPPPVPPPRKKRGNKGNKAALLSVNSATEASSVSPVVPSPASSDVFACPAAPGLPPALTPDHQASSASLDLESVVQGLSVVRSTDDEALRGGRGPLLSTPAPQQQHHSASLPTKKLELSESPADSSFYKR
jgi:hypothetical protein